MNNEIVAHGRRYVIRHATIEDLDGLMQLEELVFPSSSREDRQCYTERIAVFGEGFFVVVDESESIIGHLITEIWSTKDNLPSLVDRLVIGQDIRTWHHPSGDLLYISSIAVHPSFQGQGIGKNLYQRGIAELIEEFPSIKTLALVVSEHNPTPKAWYERMGYRVAYRKQGFYRLQPDTFIDFLTQTITTKHNTDL